MNLKKIIPFLVVILFVIFLFFYFSENKKETIKYVKIAGVTLKVDLAVTKEQQEKGLSFRNNLKNDEGMLFVFEKPSIHQFWMKDMSFPIDIIWIGEDFKVVYIEKNVNPNTYPQTFGPNKDSLYVLEVNAGFSEKNYLKENDKVIFLI
jgi:hypothetical protein